MKNKWYQKYEICEDTLDLCQTNYIMDDIAHYSFTMENTKTKQHQNKLGKEGMKNIPVNYFCEFEAKLDLVRRWKMKITWKDS